MRHGTEDQVMQAVAYQEAENQIVLALIRHGATKANRERRYLGKTDESLSEDGMETLLSCRAQNRYPDVDFLFTSPMKRCRETARILYPQLSPVVISEWKEMDFGRFEYKNYEELKGDGQYQAWIDSGGILPFPEGESREDFILRCEKGLQRMCGMLRQMAEGRTGEVVRAGAVVHGGTIMALLSVCEGKNYFDYQVSSGGGYLCVAEGWQGKEKPEENRIRIKVVKEL